MPFRSEAQRRFMYARHPEMAKRWQRHTPKGTDLPEKVHEKRSADEAFVAAFEAELDKIAAEFKRLGKLIPKIVKTRFKTTSESVKRFLKGKGVEVGEKGEVGIPTKKVRKPIAKSLKVLRKGGATGKAVASAVDDPSPKALALGAAGYAAGQPIPAPFTGTAMGAAGFTLPQTGRILKKRKTYIRRIAEQKAKEAAKKSAA